MANSSENRSARDSARPPRAGARDTRGQRHRGGRQVSLGSGWAHSARRQRQLTGKVGQRLERRAGALVDLRAGLGGQPRALLDQAQRRVGLELAGCAAARRRRSAQRSARSERRSQGRRLASLVVGPAIGSLAPRSSAQPVQRLVDQRVGVAVLCARDGANLPALEARQRRLRLARTAASSPGA